ncbi:hypothetical protein PT300_11690 [Enterobacteriaceae bacterium ESL0689]|nr:hypothetical protein [Enterobacteriaceae bacterium ESL0689]
MTERVIEISGKTVEVASPGDAVNIPVATASKLGGVKIGANLEAPGGVLNVPYGDASHAGVLKIGSRLSAETGGIVNVAIANRTTYGVVKTGDTIILGQDGAFDVQVAGLNSPGIVKQAAAVADTQLAEVTDIASAQTAIKALSDTISALQKSLRNAGVMAAK